MELHLNYHIEEEIDNFDDFEFSNLEEIPKIFDKFPGLQELHITKLKLSKTEFGLLRKYALKSYVDIYVTTQKNDTKNSTKKKASSETRRVKKEEDDP